MKSKSNGFNAKHGLKVLVRFLKLPNPLLKLRLFLHGYPDTVEFFNLLTSIVKERFRGFQLRLKIVSLHLRLFNAQFKIGHLCRKCLILAFKKRNMIAQTGR
jgi:hypothetical protein